MFISEMIAIKLISVNMNLKMLTMMWATPEKINQLESLKYQLSAWLMICTSINGLPRHIIKMAMNYSRDPL